MKTLNLTLIILSFLGQSIGVKAQTESPQELNAVQLEAIVQNSPPKITLNWEHHFTNQIGVFRKPKQDETWQFITSLQSGANQYVDNNIVIGVNYDYAIGKYFGTSPSSSGVGYISSGIEIPATENRGTIVLIVDETLAASLAYSLDRLETDFYSDGWKVVRHDVERHITGAAPAQVLDKALGIKKKIKDTYIKHPDTKAVLLFGHIPYIKSGIANPDGHGLRAYSFDAFYGDMDGLWTDYNLLQAGSGGSNMTNQIGDGMFDHTNVPTAIELQVGRIDMANLNTTTHPAFNFSKNEVELLKDYLKNNHNYRHKWDTPQQRAYIMEATSNFGGTYADVAWKSFAPLVGINNIDWNDGLSPDSYSDVLNSNNYLWSAFATAWGGPGNATPTLQFNPGIDSFQTTFATFSLSYWGQLYDGTYFANAWMASGSILTGVYTAQTDWNFHHMGMGENIGYDYLNYFNQQSTYPESTSNRRCVANLMGDPTLRMYPLATPIFLTIGATGSQLTINWQSSADTGILGYYIYRFNPSTNGFDKISSLITGNSYSYNAGSDISLVHMVKAMRLETTPSGSFYNLSQGKLLSLTCNNANCESELLFFPNAPDSDNDGVDDLCDICPGFDDNVDADGDLVPDGCDRCNGFNDLIDSDGDRIPNGCDTNPYTPDCVPDYIAGGFGSLLGTEVGIADYETDGQIESYQTIGTLGQVDYDSNISITLNAGFNTLLGADFHAFIDGCNSGAGGINLIESTDEQLNDQKLDDK